MAWTETDLDWPQAVRIVASCYPPIGLFDEVADPADLEAVFAVESLTNPRLREAAGELALVAPEDRIAGPGTSPIMAAFTHPNQDGSRFSDGSYGVYYAASDTATAVAETRHHRERLLRYQAIGPQQIAMRAYTGRVAQRFVDLRGQRASLPALYDPADYAQSQAFGRARRGERAWGICYESVRHAEGQCVAVLRPPACQPVVQAAHYMYFYDGRAITHVAEVREVTARSPG